MAKEGKGIIRRRGEDSPAPFDRTDGGDGSSELSETTESRLDELYGRALAQVYKEYLPSFSDCYRVRPYGDEHDASSPAESVASFDVTNFVTERSGHSIEKLKNVYSMLAHTDNGLALILRRTPSRCTLSIAVGSSKADSEETLNLAQSVRDAFLGNFPGSECGDVAPFSDSGTGAFASLADIGGAAGGRPDSVGIVTNVATDYSEAFGAQGIEKLVDGIQLGEDEEYTAVLLARSVSPQEVMQKKNELYGLYTALSPFSQVQRGWGVQESTAWSEQANLGVFGSMDIPIAPSLGGAFNFGISHGKTKGTNSSNTVTITQYGVSHMLEVIKKQVERIEQCEALGLWRFSAYFLSPDYRIVNEASRMYLSLTQGKQSFFERPAVNIWNALGGGGQRGEIEKMGDYLVRLQHPEFEKKAGGNGNFNQSNWPDVASCVSEISGAELTRALNLPAHSIPGLPVIECAPFGREVSSYDVQAEGDLRIGCIHHMHHDEKATPVRLSSSSLTSHVFVTGSTGSGKSNAVYTLLDELDCGFLVIEPAKGEYRHAVGKGARYFGTNYMMGELLHLNPFVFPRGIHIYEHIDRILEVFNVCWPMYAAMPAVLKAAVIGAYERCGWDLKGSRNELGAFYPTFADVCEEIDRAIVSSDYSDETKGDYRGSLKTRLSSLSNGINESLFCEGNTPDEDLFDGRAIVDLSRVGSAENKALIMGILVIRLQEHRMCQHEGSDNEGLKHVTVLEEAHNILRGDTAPSSPEMGGGLAAKSVEMIANAIAEMRTYGEGFVIVDQAPGLVDKSAIRNTNTKVILRLPDQSDRELVGKAANLNDEQIRELARLQRGVAAIYQNEWIEPVLCKVDRHEDHPLEEQTLGEEGQVPELTEEERAYLNACLYDPYYLLRDSALDFRSCVARLDAPGSRKARMLEYATAPRDKCRELYGELAFDWFGIRGLVDNLDESQHAGWNEVLRGQMAGYSFPEDVVTDVGSSEWRRFAAMMFAEGSKWIVENKREPERSKLSQRLERFDRDGRA